MAVNDVFGSSRVNIGDLLNTIAAQANDQRSRAMLASGEAIRQGLQNIAAQRLARAQMAQEYGEGTRQRAAAASGQLANNVLQALLQRGQEKADAERQAAELGLRERIATQAQEAETARWSARDRADIERANAAAASKIPTQEQIDAAAKQMGVSTEEAARTLWGYTPKTDEATSDFKKFMSVRMGEFDDQISRLSEANPDDPITPVWKYKVGVMAPALAQWRAAALSRGDAEVIATIDAYYDAQGIPNPAMQGGETSAPAAPPQALQGVPAVRAEAPWMSAIRRFAPQLSRPPVASPQVIAAQVASQPPAVSQPAVATQWPATGQWPIPVPPAQPVMAPATQQSIVNALLSSVDPLAGMAVQPKERYADESSWWDLINPLAGYEVKEKK
jgi:hypothetical protein